MLWSQRLKKQRKKNNQTDEEKFKHIYSKLFVTNYWSVNRFDVYLSYYLVFLSKLGQLKYFSTNYPHYNINSINKTFFYIYSLMDCSILK